MAPAAGVSTASEPAPAFPAAAATADPAEIVSVIAAATPRSLAAATKVAAAVPDRRPVADFRPVREEGQALREQISRPNPLPSSTPSSYSLSRTRWLRLSVSYTLHLSKHSDTPLISHSNVEIDQWKRLEIEGRMRSVESI